MILRNVQELDGVAGAGGVGGVGAGIFVAAWTFVEHNGKNMQEEDDEEGEDDLRKGGDKGDEGR